MAEAEYGDISEWPVKDGDMNSTDTIYNHYIKPYLNITKECKNSAECFSSYNIQPLHYYTFCLNDGSMVLLDLNNKMKIRIVYILHMELKTLLSEIL